MPKKPAKKKAKTLGKTELKRTRGGASFDAFLEIQGIKGESGDDKPRTQGTFNFRVSP